MDSERWRRVEQIYHSALEQPSNSREAFLVEACGGDEDLRRLINDLISQSSFAGELVGIPIWDAVAESIKDCEIGTRLGPYEILGDLGEGGMGKVYRAIDTRLDRAVAIKVSAAQFSSRFERESRAISALNHPNICTLYDIGTNYLVMELVEGETLAQRIERLGPLPLRDALDILLQIAHALEAAHGKGIVHRDLKPSNVKIMPEGRVKVLDFGLAKSIGNEPVQCGALRTLASTTNDSVAGQMLGTPAYMSPEQARGENVDSRTDIWAFGCVLYELLTGTRAFPAERDPEAIAAILEREPDWRALPARTPRRIRALLRACLEKNVQRRPSNMTVVRSCVEAEARKRMARARTSVAVAVIVLAGAGFLFWVFGRQTTFTNSELLRPMPLTTYSGTQSEPTFSPDGNQVAFSWDGENQDNFDIYVKSIGTGPLVRLTRDPAPEISPSWSPDGKWIAFLRRSVPGRNTVVLIPAFGGPEQVLAEVAEAPALSRKNLAWVPDGNSLVVYDRPPGQAGGGWLISPGSSVRRRLTTVPAGGSAPWDGGFQFAPDGRTLAFIRDVTGNSGDLYLQPLGTDLSPAGAPHRLTRNNQNNIGLAWAPDGRSLIFSSGAAGNEELWRLPVSDGARATRLTAQNEVLGLAISARSHRLVFAQSRRELDIYRVDLDKHGIGVRAAVPLIVSSRLDRRPSYSPDGKKIAFVSLRSGNWQLWICDSDGKNLVQITSFSRGEVNFPVWSSDARQIGFVATAEGPGYAYVISANGGAPRKIQALGMDERPWAWSHDGQWIFFASSRTGKLQIWKMRTADGAIEQLTTQGYSFVRDFAESFDGRFIYYPRTDGVWRVAVDGGGEERVFSYPQLSAALQATRAGIYFVSGTPIKPGELMFYRFSDRSTSKVAGAENPSFYGLSVSPDGQHLLYAKFTGIGSDLMLVENFR